MILAYLSEYISIGDAVLVATICAVGYLGIRSQRPRILQEENAALVEENKRLREEKQDWTNQKAEFIAQIRTLENRITILEGKDTERLYDLMKSHDERSVTTALQVSEVLTSLSSDIRAHESMFAEVTAVVLPIAREIQASLDSHLSTSSTTPAAPSP